MKISNIKRLSYSFTQGYAANASVSYELVCDEKCTLKYKPNGVPIENAKTYDVNPNIVTEVEALLNKFKVGKWNGFHGNDKNVLDGDSFGFYVYMKNGDRIESSGYMRFPKNYVEVRDGFESILKKVIK